MALLEKNFVWNLGTKYPRCKAGASAKIPHLKFWLGGAANLC